MTWWKLGQFSNGITTTTARSFFGCHNSRIHHHRSLPRHQRSRRESTIFSNAIGYLYPLQPLRKMGNVESTNGTANQGTDIKIQRSPPIITGSRQKARKRPQGRGVPTRSHTVIGGLGDRELDNIYKFVRQMKDTRMGECMLEDLVVKRACEEGNLSDSLQESCVGMEIATPNMSDRSTPRDRVRDFARRSNQ